MNKKAIDLVLEDCDAVIQQDLQALNHLKNDTILITGGTGFVGTWLLNLLTHLNESYQFNANIIVLARQTEAFKSKHSYLTKRSPIQFINQDIRYLSDLPADINWVVHAAMTPDNRFHASNPIETMSIIADGTLSLLNNLQRLSNLKMLLNISSGLVYGSQPNELSAISEQYLGAPKIGTVSSAYAEAKRYAETLCGSARSQAKIPTIIARPFAFIGPYQSLEAPWAINNFMRDAIQGNTIRILGDGKTLRSYLYASDMAFWLLKMLGNGQSGDIYNVGSDQVIALEQLALLVANHSHQKVDVKLQCTASDNTAHFIPDIAQASNHLQLKPSVDLETAIKRTMAWNRELSL